MRRMNTRLKRGEHTARLGYPWNRASVAPNFSFILSGIPDMPLGLQIIELFYRHKTFSSTWNLSQICLSIIRDWSSFYDYVLTGY